MFFVERDLFWTSVMCPMVNIERTVFFRQIIERLSVWCPYGIAVFACKIGYFIVNILVVVGETPDITGDRRLMVLSPLVFVSFIVGIQNFVCLWIDGDVLHYQGREHFGASAVGIDLINLFEASGKLYVVYILLYGCTI